MKEEDNVEDDAATAPFLGELLKEDPDNVTANFSLGKILLSEGKLKE